MNVVAGEEEEDVAELRYVYKKYELDELVSRPFFQDNDSKIISIQLNRFVIKLQFGTSENC